MEEPGTGGGRGAASGAGTRAPLPPTDEPRPARAPSPPPPDFTSQADLSAAPAPSPPPPLVAWWRGWRKRRLAHAAVEQAVIKQAAICRAAKVPPCPACGGERTERRADNGVARGIGLFLALAWLLCTLGCIVGVGDLAAFVIITWTVSTLGMIACAVVVGATRKRYWICESCDSAEEAPKRASDL